jgi:hypothetical protein
LGRRRGRRLMGKILAFLGPAVQLVPGLNDGAHLELKQNFYTEFCGRT